MNMEPPDQLRSDEAERALLSCLLTFPALCEDAKLTVPEEYFHHQGNLLIFNELLAMSESETPMELPAVLGWFNDRQLTDKIGGPVTLSEIFNFTATPAHYQYYRDRLRDKHLLRQTVKTLMSALQRCYDQHDDVPQAVAAICSSVVDSVKPHSVIGHKSFKAHLAEYLEVWQGRATGKVHTAIPTRWDAFNATFGGLTPTLWLVCAYPSQGKSALAQNLIEDVVATGKHAAWYSYEMDRDECLDRVTIACTNLASAKIFRPKDNPLTAEEYKVVSAATRTMNEWNIHMRPEPTWTIEQIDADVKSLCAKHDMGIVVIDYLQLVETSKPFRNRAEQVAYISRLVKRRISGANRVPVVLLSQLNDVGQTLDSRAPTQDAANIITIEDGGLLVGKNRNGRKGHHMPIFLNGALFSFEQGEPRKQPKQESKGRKPYKDT